MAETKKKPAAKKAAPKKAAPKKAASKPAEIGAQQRYRMVEVAAYFLAERNKFVGDALDYWTKAEAQIKKCLNKM